MQCDAVATRPTVMRRLDARVILLGTLGFVILVVITPLGAWRLAAFEGLALAFWIGLAGVEPRALLRRWFSMMILVGFLAMLVASGHPLRATLGFGGVTLSILTKNALAVLAVLTMAALLPFPTLLNALNRLGFPLVLVMILHFMNRYTHVLGSELERMVNARRSRSFRRSGQLDWGLLSGLIGMLFLRSMERGERVHAAMVARGWDGTFHALEQDEGDA